MELTRRDMLKASAAVAAAMGLGPIGLSRLEEALGLESSQGGLPVIWLQGQSCTGCSVSFLNSEYYGTVEDLLLNTLDLNFHATVMAAAGAPAVAELEATRLAGGYVLVVEGSVPPDSGGAFCTIHDTTTIAQAVTLYAAKAAYIVAVGTCACYGGLVAGTPNPTKAAGLPNTIAGKTVVKLPGCPVHPDWVVGAIAYILANKAAPALDANNRPTAFYGNLIHSACPRLAAYNSSYGGGHNHPTPCLSCHSTTDGNVPNPRTMATLGCRYPMGCRGPVTHGDCPTRMWNGAAANTPGVSWCNLVGSPCIGCTEPNFPDGMSPFYTLSTGNDSGPTPSTGGSFGTPGSPPPPNPPPTPPPPPTPTPTPGGDDDDDHGSTPPPPPTPRPRPRPRPRSRNDD
jgi:hydrogenase small subunit